MSAVENNRLERISSDPERMISVKSEPDPAAFHREAPDLWNWEDIHSAAAGGRSFDEIAAQYRCSVATIAKIVAIQTSIEDGFPADVPA